MPRRNSEVHSTWTGPRGGGSNPEEGPLLPACSPLGTTLYTPQKWARLNSRSTIALHFTIFEDNAHVSPSGATRALSSKISAAVARPPPVPTAEWEPTKPLETTADNGLANLETIAISINSVGKINIDIVTGCLHKHPVTISIYIFPTEFIDNASKNEKCIFHFSTGRLGTKVQGVQGWSRRVQGFRSRWSRRVQVGPGAPGRSNSLCDLIMLP